MKKLTALIYFTLAALMGQSQSIVPDLSYLKTKKERLQSIAGICDSLNYLEQYDKARQVSRFALSIADENDHYNHSLFHYYIGVSFNGVINDSAIFYLEKSLRKARLAKNDKRIKNALKELLYMYINVDGYTSKRDSTAAGLSRILDTTINADNKIDCYASLADYYSAIGWYEQELNYRLQGLELAVANMKQGKYSKTNADSTNIGVAYFNVGDLYEKLNQNAKAQEYYRLSKPLLWNYMAGICSYYKGIATTSLKLGNSNAAQLYTDSLRRTVEQQVDIDAGWNILFNLYLANADYYLDVQKPLAATPYLRQAEALVGDKVTDAIALGTFRYTMGRALMAQKNYAAALPYLQKAETVKDAFHTMFYTKLLRALGDCYEGLNQWQNAATYYKKYLPLRDSIDAKSAQQSMANAEARYQNKEKAEEIEAQKTQIEFAQKQRLWLMAGLVLLGLVAALLIFIYRNKKNAADALDDKNKQLFKLNNKLNEANQTKAKLFSIIGHDLRSPISQVYQFLKLQQLNPQALNETQKAALNSEIQAATGSLLETMEDLLQWSKTQMSEFKTRIQPVSITESMQQALALLQLSITAKNLNVSNHVPGQLIVNTDPYYLQTIIRNLLQNAVKASPENGKIVLKAYTRSITIANEGAPFTQQQYESILRDKGMVKSLNGLGLKLADELSRKINASIYFSSETAGFVTAVLKFG